MYRLWLLAVVTACGGLGIDRDIEGSVTISNGMYGQLTVSQNNIGQSAEVLQNLRVTSYSGSPPMLGINTTSDEHGFYELELTPGAFPICTGLATPAQGTSNPGPCAITTVPDSGTIRRDWVQTLEGGNWCNGECDDDDDRIDTN